MKMTDQETLLKEIDQELASLEREKTLLYREIQPIYIKNVYMNSEATYFHFGLFSSFEMAIKFSYINDSYIYKGMTGISSRDIEDFSMLDQPIVK